MTEYLNTALTYLQERAEFPCLKGQIGLQISLLLWRRKAWRSSRVRRTETLFVFSNWCDSAVEIPFHMPFLERYAASRGSQWRFYWSHVAFSLRKRMFGCLWAVKFSSSSFTTLTQSLLSDSECDSENIISRWSSRFSRSLAVSLAELFTMIILCFWPAAEEVRLQCGERSQVCLTTNACFFRTLSWE